MKLGRHRNRRRPDAQQRRAKLKLACGRLARLAAKGVLLIALGAGAVAGSVSTYRWALRSPQLALTTISFRGLRQVTEAELLQLTGLSIGENIFRVDCSGLEQAVASHPWVRRAEVYRRLDPTDPPSELRLEATGITLISQSGVEIHFGEGERAAKFARLRRIRSELSRRGLLAQSIRLDNRVRPGWIAVRPSRGTSAEGDSQGIGNQE